MKSVLFIAYFFPPAGGAGVQRSQKFVRYLPAEGIRPVVVTGPGPAGSRGEPSDASLAAEVSDQIRVVRFSEPMPKRPNPWRVRANRWMGTRSAFDHWWIGNAVQAGASAVKDVDIIFATMSPFSTTAIAQELSDRSGLPWVADLRDPWALDEMQVYPTYLHRKMEMSKMRRALSGASAVVMNTPEATAALQETFPEFKHKIVRTITNGYDAQDFEGAVTPRTDGKFRIVHTGYLHTAGGLDLRKKQRLRELLGGVEGGVDILTRSHVFLLSAIEGWLKWRPEVAQDLEIVFAGVTSQQDKDAVMQSPLARHIRMLGYLPHAESLQLVRTADVLFLPMHNLAGGRRSSIVPGKTYEYMASGRPILAAIPQGDAQEFLKRAGTAKITAPDDIKGMARELDVLYSDWKAGRPSAAPDRSYIQRFDRVQLSKQLAELFAEVVSKQAAAR